MKHWFHNVKITQHSHSMISTGSCFSNIQGSPPFEGVGAKAM